MTKARMDKLVRNILNIYAQYSEKELEDAIERIRSGQAFGNISDLRSLRSFTSNVAPRSPVKRTANRSQVRSPKERLATFISSLRSSRSEGDQKLSDFLIDVGESRALMGLRTVAEFANQLGISVGQKPVRYSLTQRIGEVLLQMEPSVRENYFKLARQMDEKKSTLHGWSKLIVKP